MRSSQAIVLRNLPDHVSGVQVATLGQVWIDLRRRRSGRAPAITSQQP
jgi:hypothetical protein